MDLPQKSTTKKIRYVGTEQFLNLATGEIQDFAVQDIEERDFNFHKVWLRNFISTLELVGNQKTKVAFWIIDNLNRDNLLLFTTREIAEETGCSYGTVAYTMKILQSADFLRLKKHGIYAVNPDIIYKGSKNARLNILNQYHEIGYIEPELTKEERINQLSEAMMILQKELNELTQQDNYTTYEVEPQLEFSADGNVVERAREIKTNE